jgi:uncharacterized protein (DUF58 family)
LALLIAGCGASAALGILHGASSFWALFYGIGGLLALTALQGAALRAVRAERMVAARAVAAGGGVRITVRLRLRSFLPVIWVAVEEPWTRQGRPFRVHRRLDAPGFRKDLTYSYTIAELARGAYESGELAVYTGDLFGFFMKRLAVPAPLAFTVHPRMTAVPYMPYRPEYPDGYGIHGIRDYRTGDPMNRIHWKASAASDRWKTKIPETQSDERILIALDCGFPDEAHLESALEAAASYARAAWERGCGVGVEACGTGLRVIPDRKQGLTPLFDALARYESDGSGGQAEAWLLNLGRAVRTELMLTVVTSRLDAARVGAMERLAKGGVRLCVLWVTEASADGDPHLGGRLQRLKDMGCRIDKIALRSAVGGQVREGGGRIGA